MRRAATLLALLLSMTACGNPSGTTAAPSASASPSATLANPLTACTTQLTYWAGELLRGAPDQGGDYQHMGLTSTSYEELLALVAAARQQQTVSEEWLKQHAETACQRIVAARATATSGWP